MFARLSRFLLIVLAPVVACTGCHPIREADRRVYSAIHDGQMAALGTTTDVYLGPESGEVERTPSMYDFTPHPVDPGIPAPFRADEPPAGEVEPDDLDLPPPPPPPPGLESEAPSGAGEPSAEAVVPLPPDRVMATPPSDPPPDDLPSDAELPPEGVAAEDEPQELLTPEIFSSEQIDEVTVFSLSEALAYAMDHARTLQAAKEELYLVALDLTLERHLWTPQFVAALDADYVNAGQAAGFEQAMTVVSDVALVQRLPYGGEVTARVISNLVRDLSEDVTTLESGTAILEASIPLLRGAGRVAYETRYQAERNLIYAIRSYERFRREFLVDVAARYFALQGNKAAIDNTYVSYRSRLDDWRKAEFINRIGQSRNISEAPRAKSILRQAEAQLVSAKERYATALDQFKIFIGMPVGDLLDVISQDEDEDSTALDDLLPEVDLLTAEQVALDYRLDLLNEVDRVDDARRLVLVARNSLLPDLEIGGRASVNTPTDRFNAVTFNTEYADWAAGVSLRMDDRVAERNAYRRSLISLRRSQRNLNESMDQVRAAVRSAVRGIEEQAQLRVIQALNVEENEFRLAAAKAQYDLGRSTNQDVVDAENDLLTARNQLAAAVAGYRNAILQFRLETGTLRVTEDGNLAPSLGTPTLPEGS